MEDVCLIEFVHPSTFHIFLRGQNGDRRRVIDRDFYPYFYIPSEVKIPESVAQYIKEATPAPNSLYGDKTTKLTFKFMDDRATFRKIRESFPKTFEDDVVFSSRYLIDHDIKFTKNYRICTLDIETSMEFPIKDVRNCIRAITFHDNIVNRYVTYCVSPSNLIEKREMSPNWNIYFVLTEQDLLNSVIQYFKVCEPDIITGWNTSGFDLPYIYSRMVLNGLPVSELSPLLSVYVKSDIKDNYAMNNNKIYGEVRIKGIQCLDSMKVLEKVTGGALHSYRLESVANLYLNEGKTQFEGKLDELYKNDVMKYCKYNMHDVELVVRLNKTPGILNYFMAMQDYSPVNLTDMFYVSRPIDNLILRTYHDKVVFPSKRKNIKEKYIGAHVKDPFVGIIPNVVAFDVRALYTNLQISLNICASTKSPDGDIDIHGVKFKSRPEGLIPKILKNLQTERNRLKYEMKKYTSDSVEYKQYYDRQNSVKVLLNSFYGVMGSPYYRSYDKQVAESITLSGQDINREIGQIIEEAGHNSLYGDTDSNFVKLNLKDGEDMILAAENLRNYVNIEIGKRIAKRTNRACTVEIEFEKAFKSFMMIGKKKKYCGLLTYKDGKKFDSPVFFEMGFEGRKRDSTPITKKLERNCLICLLNGGNRDDILKIARDGYSSLKSQPIKDLAIKYKMSKQIDEYKNKNSQHIRAVMNARKFYEAYYEPGDTINFVFAKSFDGKRISNDFKNSKDVIAINENTPMDKLIVDWDATAERNITKKLSHIFEAFGWLTTELDPYQKSLGGYL